MSIAKKTSAPENQDVNFTLHINDGTWPTEKVQVMLLCDIRRELKGLNNQLAILLNSHAAMVKTLQGIRKNTYKRRKTVRVRQTRPKA